MYYFFYCYLQVEAKKYTLHSQLSIMNLKISTIEDMSTELKNVLQRTHSIVKKVHNKVYNCDMHSPLSFIESKDYNTELNKIRWEGALG